jgi:hypothetical protein
VDTPRTKRAHIARRHRVLSVELGVFVTALREFLDLRPLEDVTYENRNRSTSFVRVAYSTPPHWLFDDDAPERALWRSRRS